MKEANRQRPAHQDFGKAQEGDLRHRPAGATDSSCNDLPSSRTAGTSLGREPRIHRRVYRIVTALPADLVTFAHDGTKAFTNTFERVHRRKADGPNAIWQADRTPLDIPPIRPAGAAAQPWAEDRVAAIIRNTGGNFRPLQRLLTRRSGFSKSIRCGN